MQFGFSFEGKSFSPPAILYKVFKVRSSFCLRKATLEIRWTKERNKAQSKPWWCFFILFYFFNLNYILLASDTGEKCNW